MAYRYKVVHAPDDQVDQERLEDLLNEHAEQGWRLRAITTAGASERFGDPGPGGVLLTLERIDYSH